MWCPARSTYTSEVVPAWHRGTGTAKRIDYVGISDAVLPADVRQSHAPSDIALSIGTTADHTIVRASVPWSADICPNPKIRSATEKNREGIDVGKAHDPEVRRKMHDYIMDAISQAGGDELANLDPDVALQTVTVVMLTAQRIFLSRERDIDRPRQPWTSQTTADLAGKYASSSWEPQRCPRLSSAPDVGLRLSRVAAHRGKG